MAKNAKRKAVDFRQQIQSLQRRFKNKLNPPLDNVANRYKIFLPVFSETESVFARKQIPLLQSLLKNCCGGFSTTMENNGPPWRGEWLSPIGETVVDYHILIVAYAKYSHESDLFFGKLKTILEQGDVAGQEIVVIEKITVNLLKKAEL